VSPSHRRGGAGTIALYRGLGRIEDRFDALILDLWGVVMDGTAPYRGATECLARLHQRGKTVLLLSNAPRRESIVAERLAGMGIGPGLYDRIVSSGEASRRALARRAHPAFAAIGRRYLYVGPERDRGLLAGLDYREAPLEKAEFVLNTGVADDTDTLEVVRPTLEAARARGLPMVCTNPDRVVVRHSGQRVLCAGALAEAYEALGGVVHYFGKPHRAVYELCFELLDGVDLDRVLAVGDNLETDIAGAKAAGLKTVLVLGGVLAEPLGIEWGELAPPERLEALCAEHGVLPDMAIPALVW
jgi:HAD superfamily hydrolase (TIGR01459 family)